MENAMRSLATMTAKPLPKTPPLPTPPLSRSPAHNRPVSQYDPTEELHGRASGPELIKLWTQALTAFSTNALLEAGEQFIKAIELVDYEIECRKIKPSGRVDGPATLKQIATERRTPWPADVSDAFLAMVNGECRARLRFNVAMVQALKGEHRLAHKWFLGAVKANRTMVVAKYARGISLAEIGMWRDSAVVTRRAWETLTGLMVQDEGDLEAIPKTEPDKPNGIHGSGPLGKTEFWEIEVVDWNGIIPALMFPHGCRLVPRKIYRLERLAVLHNYHTACLNITKRNEVTKRSDRRQHLTRKLYQIQRDGVVTEEAETLQQKLISEINSLLSAERQEKDNEAAGILQIFERSGRLNGLPAGMLLPPPLELVDMYSESMKVTEGRDNLVSGDECVTSEDDATEANYDSMNFRKFLNEMGERAREVDATESMLSSRDFRQSAIPQPLRLASKTSESSEHSSLRGRKRAQEERRQTSLHKLSIQRGTSLDQDNPRGRLQSMPRSSVASIRDDHSSTRPQRVATGRTRCHSLLSQTVFDTSDDESADNNAAVREHKTETRQISPLQEIIQEANATDIQEEEALKIQSAPLRTQQHLLNIDRRRRRAQTAAAFFPYARRTAWTPHRSTYDFTGRVLDLYFLLDIDELEGNCSAEDTEEDASPFGRFARDVELRFHPALNSDRAEEDGSDNSRAHKHKHHADRLVTGNRVKAERLVEVRLDAHAIRGALGPSPHQSVS
jgi:hypothetical protein